jgi:arginyl-tRNA synthetase
MRAIKNELSQMLRAELAKYSESKGVSLPILPDLVVEETPEEHGDLSSNLAMRTAKGLRMSPAKLAAALIEGLGENKRFGSLIAKAAVAGPGFLNFWLSAMAYQEMLAEVLTMREKFGNSPWGKGRKVLVEFVSANPTGPLTVAHGRQAAVGDVLAAILSRAGFQVSKEYLINDRGRQIEILGRSTFARYQELLGKKSVLPEDGYQGTYVTDVARRAMAKVSYTYADATEERAVPFFSRFAREDILQCIQEDLKRFGVGFDRWFSETEFHATGKVEEVLERLRKKGHVYDKDNAVWFRSTTFGDDKDRVLVKSSGDMTYITPDIAYHDDKLIRGFDALINIWGPDHHGYVPRMQAALQALGYSKEALRVIILQLVTLRKDGKQLSMSTRAGEFVTLKEVLDEVGKDASRYFFVRRKTDSHLDFDLDLARKQTPENPVFYVQYAHARIASIFRKASDEGIDVETVGKSPKDLEPLKAPAELKLIRLLSQYEEVLESSAKTLEPHWIPHHLEACSAQLHKFYTECRVLGEANEVVIARLALCAAAKIVLKNGLTVLGVNAPDSM